MPWVYVVPTMAQRWHYHKVHNLAPAQVLLLLSLRLLVQSCVEYGILSLRSPTLAKEEEQSAREYSTMAGMCEGLGPIHSTEMRINTQ